MGETDGAMSDAVPVPLSELLRTIQTAVRSKDAYMCGLRVCGDVVSVHRHAASGHVYFELGDGARVMKCAMWKSFAQTCNDVPLVVGARVVVVLHRVSVYERGGSVTLHVRSVVSSEPLTGACMREKESLIAALAAEGAFERPRRCVDAHARDFCRVGVVTSLGSAAHADIESGVHQRWRGYDVVYRHASMQGTTAPRSIRDAIAQLVHDDTVGVIICARGGGSKDDLRCFDDETVVRAVLDCAVPIVVAVGHESDTSIADSVADRRAKTPTAAVDMVIPERSVWAQKVQRQRSELQTAATECAGAAAHAVRTLRRQLTDVTALTAMRRRQHVSSMQHDLQTTVGKVVRKEAERLQRSRAALTAAIEVDSVGVQRQAVASARSRVQVTLAQRLTSECQRLSTLRATLEGVAASIAMHVIQSGLRKRRLCELDTSAPFTIVFEDGGRLVARSAASHV